MVAGPDITLTIAIVTCNRPRLADRLISEVLTQAADGDEVVVVDDAGAGHQPYCAGAPVRVLVTRGQGAAAARNAALRVADRPWLLFLDDDVTIPPDLLASVRARIATANCDVITMNVRSDDTTGAVGMLRDERYPLSRGDSVAVFAGHTGTKWNPEDVWRVGVGAAMAWRREALQDIGGFPATLGQGRRYGGAEDLYAFRRALLAGWTIRYDGELVVGHLTPTSWAELRRTMRGYALAEGAFAAHVWRVERRFGMTKHLLVDVVSMPRWWATELLRAVRGRPHLPLGAIGSFPWRAARGFLGYLRTRPVS